MVPKYGFEVTTLYENGKIKKSDVENLIDFLKTENLPSDCVEYIAITIICCEGDLEKSKQLLSANFKARKHIPEIFKNRFLDEDAVKEWNVMEFAVAPEKMEDGSVLFMMRYNDPVASNFHLDLTAKLFLMCVDSILYEEPCNGFVFLLDLSNMSFKHFLRIQISILRRMMRYMGEGIIHLVKKIHLINGGFVVEKLYQLFKVISKPETFELFTCHASNLNWEKFYEDHIPKKYLPLDYGGQLDSMKNLNTILWEKLENLESFFIEEQEWRQSYEKSDKY